MLSGNGVKTVRCSFDALHDPLRLKTLSGNGAQFGAQGAGKHSPVPGKEANMFQWNFDTARFSSGTYGESEQPRYHYGRKFES
jgi:hypothetical protein